ncbi:MAG: hypothetical protein WCJ56_01065 [bacterium]
MTDIDILHKLIKDTAKEPFGGHYINNKVTLSEGDGYSINIKGIPDDAIVIKVDAFISPDTIFAGSRGEGKRADYVIIANMPKKKVIIYIEMKKTNKNKKHIIQQLTGAKCFISYCTAVGNEFWKECDFLKGYEERYVSIGHISISKKKTRIEATADIHDVPEKMMKIDWPNILEFNRLAGKCP